MKDELTYDEFMVFASDSVIEKVLDEECRYGDGEQTTEHWYYSNIRWITSLLDENVFRKCKLSRLNNGKNMEL